MDNDKNGNFNGEILMDTLHKVLDGVYLPLFESQKQGQEDVLSTVHVDFVSRKLFHFSIL